MPFLLRLEVCGFDPNIQEEEEEEEKEVSAFLDVARFDEVFSFESIIRDDDDEEEEEVETSAFLGLPRFFTTLDVEIAGAAAMGSIDLRSFMKALDRANDLSKFDIKNSAFSFMNSRVKG